MPKPKKTKPKKRRFLAPLMLVDAAAQELELDPLTGAIVRHGVAPRSVWVRKNKPEAEQRFQFYAPLSDARRIHQYVLSKPDLTYSKFFRLAALEYLRSKGQ